LASVGKLDVFCSAPVVKRKANRAIKKLIAKKFERQGEKRVDFYLKKIDALRT